MPSISHTQLTSIAAEFGLSLCSVLTNLKPHPESTLHLKRWQEKGYGADLEYMYREAELFTSPLKLFPEAKSIVLFAVHYSNTPCGETPAGHGRVARYAWGKDYHRVLRKRMTKFIREVESTLARPLRYRLFTDAVPLLERSFSQAGGLGFVGKNTMLIRPREGSFFFLAEVLWDVEVEVRDSKFSVLDESCGRCTKCLTSCPTNAFADPFVLDSNRCISYLTIEKRGALSSWEREAIGEWLFGCDICQEVCPFNHSPMKSALPVETKEFGADAGAGPFLSLKDLFDIRTEEHFLNRFAGTPLMRAKREGLLRNACAVAVNKNETQWIPVLCTMAQEDPSSVLRQHALWAASKLSRNDGEAERMRHFVEKVMHRESDPFVLEEAELLLQNW